jgi:hypothetical protein
LSLSSQAALVAETAAVRRLGTGLGMGVYRFWERMGNAAGPFLVATLVAVVGYEQAIGILGGTTLLSCVIYVGLMTSWRERPS